jgi:hypothetical protein
MIRRVKLLEICAESPASGARFVSLRFSEWRFLFWTYQNILPLIIIDLTLAHNCLLFPVSQYAQKNNHTSPTNNHDKKRIG